MSYDQKCYDLAEIFLSDEPEMNTEPNRHELAQAIQDVIEAHMSFHFKKPAHSEHPDCIQDSRFRERRNELWGRASAAGRSLTTEKRTAQGHPGGGNEVTEQNAQNF